MIKIESTTAIRNWPKLQWVVAVFLLALAVRSLTGYFIFEHMTEPAWFQPAQYALVNDQAQEVLDGKRPVFWIDDPTRTDLLVYPPGYSLWMAFVFGVSGDRSPYTLQAIQIVFDSLSVLLLIGIFSTLYGTAAGIISGILAAISPIMAYIGATPNTDAPTTWLVLGAVWLLIMSIKRESLPFALAAGGTLGIACWIRVNPVFLFVCWAVAVPCFMTGAKLTKRLSLAAAMAGMVILIVSPILLRNVIVFYPKVALTGLGVGHNLWVGIGETERGPEFGAPASDVAELEQERIELGVSDHERDFALYYPDGIERDAARARKAEAVIMANPIWYAGAALKRVWGHVKYFGRAQELIAMPTFRVSGERTLPPGLSFQPLKFLVDVLGWIQLIWNQLALPLMGLGIIVAFNRDRMGSALVLATIAYYMATLAVGHSEVRYGQPMQALLIGFAAVGIGWLLSMAFRRLRSGVG